MAEETTESSAFGDRKYNYESERLKSFSRWPLDFLDPELMARIGFIYTGYEDRVVCHFCSLTIYRWQRGDCPVRDHLGHARQCPLLNKQATENVPIDERLLNSILPPFNADVAGLSHSISNITLFDEAFDAGESENSLHLFRNRISYPKMALESKRLQSFADWPRSMHQTPRELADAGFFYDGTGDRVICFCCNLRLKDWDYDDIAWEQHAIWGEDCEYLKTIKGERYIRKTLEDFFNKQAKRVVCEEKTSSSDEEDDDKYGARALNKSKSVDDEDDEDVKYCKICRENRNNIAFIPCGHVSCAKCALVLTKCPMCRDEFKQIVKIYL